MPIRNSLRCKPSQLESAALLLAVGLSPNKYKNKTCQIKNLKLSELLEMIERLENMIINRTCLMEEHIKDYIVKRYNMD